ncbi:7-carboxy-7-deazaguanine synthase QueE [Thermomonas sp.]|uniref:7-carboxy-7-deazaguanine synthase QueE n=1 Tax=Thermomonas sp. TaxID=1971895 RepID=UPI002624559D|nr:7-carboxy-7-deazaguanine synthase QueE [Thermomonas sp.]
MNAGAEAASALATASAGRLKLTEIFLSLQGEAREAGWPTVFVRLTGCPLRCQYCDTTYAFHGGQWWTQEAILDKVAAFGARHVCVTGGEPLAQKECIPLLARLCDAGHAVSLETSGALDIAAVDPRVSRVLDIKTPGSGEVVRNLWSNLDHLTAHDQIKFVICSREDFDWARGVLEKHRLDAICDVFFSPSFGKVQARELAEWILAERLPVRFQMQLHKILWGDEPGR